MEKFGNFYIIASDNQEDILHSPMNKLRQPIAHKTLLAAEVYDDLIHEIVMIRKAVLNEYKSSVNTTAAAQYY